MKTLPIISFNPKSFEIIKHDVATDDATQAIFHLVRTLPAGDDLLFICGDTFAPFTFDTTIIIMGGLDSAVNSDRFKCTKRTFDHMVIESVEKDNYLGKTNNFCRKLVSKSGLACDVFEMFHGVKMPFGGWPVELHNPKKLYKPTRQFG
jgi:hypothetical protein